MDRFLVAADSVDTMFTTSDGGNHWNRIPAPPMEGGVAQCHDYGQGKYRLFSYYYGQIYTTTDNWQTVDSTKPIISDSSKAIKYGFGQCRFAEDDTIFAFGNYFNFNNDPFPLIARTTDGGQDWTLVYDDTVDLYGSVRSLSDVNRDTIVAGIGGESAALWSTDHGATWQIDTLICNDTGFIPASNYGIGLNTQGNLLGTYALGKISSSLIIGSHITSRVVSSRIQTPEELLFPNPAATSVTLMGAAPGSTVHLLDILGRDVLSAKVSASGSLTLDVSQLPRGMYEVVIEQDGAMLPVGRIVLAGE